MQQQLTPEGLRIVTEVAARHGVSVDAALGLLAALAEGHGSQAQFNHPDLGGMGQWSQGGMIMVGDMFNQGLKYRVDALCNELAGLLRSQPPTAVGAVSFQSQSQGGGGAVSLFVPGTGTTGAWWPADLGAPASTGAQNDMRYAWFPGPRRVAIQQGGEVRVYDSGEHQISGFSQQQGADRSLTFTSQFGVVRLSELALVSPRADPSQNPPAPAAATPARDDRRAAAAPPPTRRAGRRSAADGRAGRRSGCEPCDGGDRQDDRAACGATAEEHSDRRRVRGEEGGAPRSPVGAAAERV